MKDFSNENVGKEYKKLKNLFFIGLFCYALAVAILAWSAFKGEEKPKELPSVHELIVNKDSGEKEGYIDVTGEPYRFAYYEGNSNYFYFVPDKDYIYVVRMSSSDYTKLKSATDENPIKISGKTKTLKTDIKKLGIEAWNETVEKDKKLSLADFDDWFGAVYLDLSAPTDEETKTSVAYIFVFLAAIFGLAFTLTGGIATWRFKRKIKKLSNEEKEKIDKEMNDKDAFYYKNAHMYLTKNYIVNFASTFEAIPYKNIIWVYKYELRQNGIKTQQSVKVMTKDGKTHVIATLSGLTKKAKDVFDEILETVATRSTNALIGYTKENRNKVKEKIEK